MQPGPIILLVDDEPTVRLLARARLVKLGFQVVEAADAETVRAILGDGQAPDLVIIDANLSGQMDGLHLAEEIRQRYPDTRLMLTSGAPLPADSPFPFVWKPWRPNELAEALGSLLPEPAGGR